MASIHRSLAQGHLVSPIIGARSTPLRPVEDNMEISVENVEELRQPSPPTIKVATPPKKVKKKPKVREVASRFRAGGPVRATAAAIGGKKREPAKPVVVKRVAPHTAVRATPRAPVKATPRAKATPRVVRPPSTQRKPQSVKTRRKSTKPSPKKTETAPKQSTPSDKLRMLTARVLQWKFAIARLKHALMEQQKRSESLLYSNWLSLFERKDALANAEYELAGDINGNMIDQVVNAEKHEIDEIEDSLSGFMTAYASLSSATAATTRRLPLTNAGGDPHAILRALKECESALKPTIDHADTLIELANGSGSLAAVSQMSSNDLVQAREMLAALSLRVKEEQSVAIHLLNQQK